MGCTYLLYLEGKVDGKWKCLNGWYREVPYGQKKAKLMPSHLYWSESRSSFGETYEKLSEIGRFVPFSKLSPEVRKAHPDFKFKWDWMKNEETREEETYLVVPLEAFRATVPKGFENHGVYHKDMLERFDAYETDELWNEEEPDLSSMDPEERKCWEYREWDDRDGWRRWFKKLNERVDAVLEQRSIDTWDDPPTETRIVAFCL